VIAYVFTSETVGRPSGVQLGPVGIDRVALAVDEWLLTNANGPRRLEVGDERRWLFTLPATRNDSKRSGTFLSEVTYVER